MSPTPIATPIRLTIPSTSEHASRTEDPAQCPDQCVVVGLDDRGPGDDEDVPAGLERGRHHPERLADPAPDAVPDHGSSEPLAGREPEPGLVKVRPDEPSDQQGVRPATPPSASLAKSPGRESMTSRSGL